MPLRDQLALLKPLAFFQLDRQEDLALAEFNMAYQQAMETHKVQQISRWQQKYPTLKLPVNFFKHYEQVIATRGQYHTLTSDDQDSNSAYQHLDDRRKAPPLAIALPKSLCQLDGESLIRLAFAEQGEHFYHYLTQCVNDSIKLQVDRTGWPNQSTAYFYEHLNRLDSEEFHQLFHTSTTKLPLLYIRLESYLEELGYPSPSLACTDGQPLEFIAGKCLYFLLAQQEELGPPSTAWTKQAEQELYLLAFHHGSFDAACYLTDQTLQRIAASQSLSDIMEQYQWYISQYYPLMEKYHKAAGSLWLVIMQKRLINILNQAVLTDATPERLNPITAALYLDLYRALRQTQKLSEVYKNPLRLWLNSDHCQALIRKTFANDGANIHTLYDALACLKDQRPDLQHDFELIDQQFSGPRSGVNFSRR